MTTTKQAGNHLNKQICWRKIKVANTSSIGPSYGRTLNYKKKLKSIKDHKQIPSIIFAREIQAPLLLNTLISFNIRG